MYENFIIKNAKIYFFFCIKLFLQSKKQRKFFSKKKHETYMLYTIYMRARI